MRSFSRAIKLAVGGIGLAAALLGAVVTPANAEGSGLKTTTASAPTAGVATDTLPDVGVSAVPILCFRGHVQDVGWQGWDCDNDGSWAFAGTTGQGRRLEALQVVAYNTGGFTCTQPHLQNVGWRTDQVCATDGVVAEVGTTGHGLRIEALAFGSTTRSICAEAHVQNKNWMGVSCSLVGSITVVGTEAQGLRMEAVRGSIY